MGTQRQNSINIDQDVSIASTPQFANIIITGTGEIRPSVDSTAAITISKANGDSMVIFDTTNFKMGIGCVPTDTLTMSDATTIFKVGLFTGAYIGTTTNHPLYFDTNNSTKMTLLASGNLGIGLSPTAVLTLKAGTASANTAPLKLTSGTLMTNAEAGAIEFLSDDFYATITTAAERKKIVLANSTTRDIVVGNIYPMTDNTSYIGKNDDDTPFAYKGIILKDQGGTGKYYRVEIVDNALQITDLTD